MSREVFWVDLRQQQGSRVDLCHDAGRGGDLCVALQKYRRVQSVCNVDSLMAVATQADDAVVVLQLAYPPPIIEEYHR